MPTETVYGLAADTANDDAVAAIFAAKSRPRFNPLICHVSDLEAAARLGVFNNLARTLAERFWPGPLTLVLPRRADANVSLLASAGLDTIALRAPAHGVAQRLLQACARPLAAPSANPSGAVSPTTADHVRESLGDNLAAILDGGPSAVGVESTIVAVEGACVRLLRPGGVSREDLEKAIGAPLLAAGEGVKAPGMMKSHYAPAHRLRINAAGPTDDEVFIAFGVSDAAADFNLSPTGDLREAAAVLFRTLRDADAACRTQGATGIAVAAVPTHGLGEAINDRLARAAAPRDGSTARARD